MKNKIIDESIRRLRAEGLRFSVDSLAAALGISKKTVYKYFPTKEALALSMYEAIYKTATEQLTALCGQRDRSALAAALRVYYDAKVMSRDDIFNKYQLNAPLRAYTAEQNDRLWRALTPAQGTSNDEAVRLIVDGALEKCCQANGDPDAVIERLVTLL